MCKHATTLWSRTIPSPEISAGFCTVRPVPYFVRVSTTDPDRMRTDTHEAFAMQIGEMALKQQFVRPWVARKVIVCSGLEFDPNTTRLQILFTQSAFAPPLEPSAPRWNWLKRQNHVHDETDRFVKARIGKPQAGPPPREAQPITSVFLVHGHDTRLKLEAARVIERCTGLDATILHEQANQGLTLIEKLEAHAGLSGFAVILMTADDVGGVKDSAPEDLQPRARQNVVFEHGLFVGLLGRNRVAVLYEPAVEIPTDLDGLAYIELDPGGNWRSDLLKEFEAAGMQVNRTRMP